MKRVFPFLIVFGALLSLMIFLQWLNARRNHTFQEPERQVVMDNLKPVLDNLFTGLNNRDINIFKRDFGKKISGKFDEKSFSSLQNSLAAFGEYQEARLEKLEILNGYYIATYTLLFKNGKAGLKVILIPKPPYSIEGLSFKL